MVPERETQEFKDLLPHLRLVLNHYEFVSAGIRRGDVDEQLVKDAERGTILSAYESLERWIFELRTNRRRQSLYEHLEWLHRRWEKNPPHFIVRSCERCKGSPFQGRRNTVRA